MWIQSVAGFSPHSIIQLIHTFLTFFMVSDYACTRMDDENGWTGLGCRGCPCLPQHWGSNPGLTLRYYSYQSNSGINPGLPQQIDINPRLTIILSIIILSWYFFSFGKKNCDHIFDDLPKLRCKMPFNPWKRQCSKCPSCHKNDDKCFMALKRLSLFYVILINKKVC